MSINRVIISGNLTRDPEIRQTASGSAVMQLGIAVNDRRKNQQTGEWEDYPNFIDCTMFGNRAEAICQYLEKGSKVAIEGKLRWSQWEKDGQKRSKIEVIIDEIELMGGGQRQGNQPTGAQRTAQQQTQHQGYQQQRPPANGYQMPQVHGYQPQANYQPQPYQQTNYAQPQGYQQPQQVIQAQVGLYDEDIPF